MLNTNEGRLFTFPNDGDDSIVIITGNSLRHKRFALRIIQEFEPLVKTWFQIDDLSSKQSSNREKKEQTLLKYIEKFNYYGFWKSLKIFFNKNIKPQDSYQQKIKEAEIRFFKDEVTQLQKKIKLKPHKISVLQIKSLGFINHLKKINPFLLLTLGGPLYSKEIISSVKGVAINQHAGIAPFLKGSYTTEWALYHRNLNLVGSTVHIMNAGADNGPIIKQSFPSILPDDNIEDIFLRVVVLGSELIIETINEILKNREIQVYDQNKSVGTTYLAKQFTSDIFNRLKDDFDKGWLQMEMNRQRNF